MMTRSRSLLTCLAILASLQAAEAQVQAYTDEAAFLAALTANSIPATHESFEDDAAWGHVRTTIVGGQKTAPSVNSRGVTWTANNGISGITTGEGPARTGSWGFFQLPHGDWNNGITDGFIGIGDQQMVAIGGWIKSTGNAKISLELDGVPVDFGGNSATVNVYQFFGAIDLGGFAQFEYIELEATPDDWKLIFAEDFTFAFGGTLVDCNQNGVGDALDIGSGLSEDCNANLIPDECEIAADGGSAGGPYFCTQNCDPDCNGNGIIDACEVTVPTVHGSGPLSPIGNGFPQSFLIPTPPAPQLDVILSFSAYGNLGGPDEYIDVDINGFGVGSVFVLDGSDCPDGPADVAQLIVPLALYQQAVGSGDATINLVASTEVAAFDCENASTISVEVTLFASSPLDANGNGIPDECEELGTRYCVGAPNSVHSGGAHVHALGSSVVADNDFTLETRDLPPNVFGLHYFGQNQIQIPFGDGFRCAGGSIVRLKVVKSSSTGVSTWPVDLTAPPAAGVIGPGSVFNFQHWYRDPAGGPAGFNFSDGVEVVF